MTESPPLLKLIVRAIVEKYLNMKNQENFHEVEFSFLYMHYNDAKKFNELAKEENSKLKSFYARHSIISVVFALESLINRVLFEFCLFKKNIDTFDKLSLPEKWLTAPLVCGKDRPIGKTFDSSSEPFQSFSELVKIRNWFAHPKSKDFIPATKTPWTIHIVDLDKEVPWIETKKGDNWPQTKIPKNPFDLTEIHSQKALDIFKSMKEELLVLFEGVLSEDWLWIIKLKNIKTNEIEKITLDSLWGGFTPNND